jgi:predicted phage tail protein
MDKILITCVKNPFDPIESREIKEVDHCPSIQRAVREFFPAPGDANLDVVVTLTSPGRQFMRTLTPEEIETIVPIPGDSIVFCATPHGDDGKSVLSVVAMLALVIFAPYMAGVLGPMMGVTAVTATGSLTMAGSMIAGGIVAAGGFLINTFLAPKIDTGDIDGSETSQTYSWNPLPNNEDEGQVCPVLYGRHRVTPPRIGRYVSVAGGQSTQTGGLRRVALASGGSGYNSPVGGFPKIANLTVVQTGGSGGTIYCSVASSGAIVATLGVHTPGTGYTAGNAVATSGGGGVGCTVNITGVGTVAESSTQYLQLLFAVADHAVDSIELVEIDDNPIAYYDEDVACEIRTGETEQPIIPYFNDTSADVPVGLKLSTDWTTRQTSGDIQGFGIGLYCPGLVYVDDEGYYEVRTVTPIIEYRMVGAGSWTTMATDAITEATTDVVRRFWRVDDLPTGQYEFQIKRSEAEATSPREQNKCYWEYYQTYLYDDFSYPGTALLGVQALATDKLSSTDPRITCVAERSTVQVWTGAAYESKPANNPAWACYDMLHNSDYGMGKAYSKIIYADFLSWATWCTSKGYTCNVYFDSSRNLRASMAIVGALGRGQVIQRGSRFSCIYDSDSLPAQRFLFTMGSIEKDSFKEEWLDMDGRANIVEVTYWDEDENWAKRTVTIEQEGYDDLTDRVPATIDLVGCTDRDMAIKYGKYSLNKNRYITLTASWGADVDAIGCVPGDVIEVAHDVPQWGYSGRIVSATSSGVVLDRDVTLEPGTTYTVYIKHLADDTREAKTVTAVGVETITDTLTLTTSWGVTPAPLTEYSFGEVGQATKLFRLAKTTRASSMRRTLVAVEHVTEVYDDTATIPVPETISDLDAVTGLMATETFRYNANGTGTSAIILTWRGSAVKWRVYRRGASGSWMLIGETSNQYFELESNFPIGQTIEFAVSATRNPDDGDDCSITIVGTPYIPDAPTGLTVTLADQTVTLEWTASTAVSVVAYNIYLNTVLLVEKYTGHEYVYAGALIPGDYDFTVTALDAYNQESDPSTEATLTVTAPGPSEDLIINFGGQDCYFTWTPSTAPAFSYYSLTINGVEKRITNSTTAIYRYSFDENVEDNTTPDPSLSYSLSVVDIFGNASTPVTGTATNTAPSAIADLTADFTGRDCIFTWTKSPAADLDYHRLTINSTEYEIAGGSFVYPFDQNRIDNTGADPSLTYSLAVIDVFGQESSAATGTATNAAPSVPTGLGVTASFQTVMIRFTGVTDADIQEYEVHISTVNGFTPGPSTLYTTGPQTEVTYEGESLTTYYVKVRAKDVFGQYSSYTSQASGTTDYVPPVELYRTDFVVKNSIFYFTTTTLTWTSGSIIMAGTEYTLSSGTLASANSKYVIATLSGRTATISIVALGAMPTLTADQIIIGYTSASTTSDGNYICYVRQANSMMVEGMDIRDATIYEAKIKNLAVTDAKILTCAVSKLTAGTITSQDIVLSVSGGTGDVAIRAGKTDFATTTAGFIIGLDYSDSGKSKAYFGDTSNYFYWDGSNVYTSGVVNTKSGYIGGTSGWVVTTGVMKDPSGVVGMSAVDSISIWAGHATPASAPFRVTSAGAVVATSATITGDITATSGYFQAVTLGKTGIASGTITLQIWDGHGDTYIAAGKTDFVTTTAGFILGLDDSDGNKAKFYLGSSTSYLYWDGTNLTMSGIIYAGGTDISGTTANVFTVNSDSTDANVQLVLGRTTGGNAIFQWDGTAVSLDKTFNVDHIGEGSYAHAVVIDGVTLKDGGSLIITGGSNTFNLTNGSANLDVAYGVSVDINYGLTVSGISTIDQNVSTTAGPTFNHIHSPTVYVDHIGEASGGHGVFFDQAISVDHINEVTVGHAVVIDGVTLKDGGSLVVTGGANTFNLTNGTASLDIAAGAAVDVNYNLTVSGASTINQDVSTTAGPTWDHVHTASIIAPAAVFTLKPTTDAVTAIQLQDKDGTSILNIDTTNNRVGINTVGPDAALDVLTISGAQLRLSYTDGSVYSDFTVGSGGNLTVAPTGDLIFDPTGNDILPNTNYDLNMGAINKKYLTLHAAELWVETLVAQSTIATIGGRILVGPTNILTSDLTAGATTIYVKYNNLVNGDRVYMEANGSVEFMAITSSAGGVGPYSYTVTRNLDGTGANAWYAGDALFDTGQTGNGFIDIYSLRGVKAASQYGPAIVGNVRNSATYNDWTECWAIGNLNGVYGYGVTTYGAAFGKYGAANYLTVDSTNGIRFFDSSNTLRAQLSSSTWTLGLTTDNHIAISTGHVQIKNGSTVYTDLAAGSLTLGVSTDDNILISTGHVYIRNGSTVYTDLAAGVLTLGEVGSGKSNVYIGSGIVQLRNNTTARIQLAADGSGFLANSSISWDTSGNLTIGASAYIGGSTNGWQISTGAITALGTGIFQTSASASTGIKIDSTSFRGYNGSVQTAEIKTDGSGWFGLVGTKAIQWTTAGAVKIGNWNINGASLYTGTEDHSGYTTNAGDMTIYSDGYDASIHAKNFYIDTTGTLYATGVTISGSLKTSDTVGTTKGVLLDASANELYFYGDRGDGTISLMASMGINSDGVDYYVLKAGSNSSGNSRVAALLYGYNKPALKVQTWASNAIAVTSAAGAYYGISINSGGTTGGGGIYSLCSGSGGIAINASATGGGSTSYAIKGISSNAHSIYGESANNSYSGIAGYHSGSGRGVAGNSASGYGVAAYSGGIVSLYSDKMSQFVGSVGISAAPSGVYLLQLSSDSAGKPGAGGLWTVVSDERIKTDIELADLDRCYEIVKSIPLKRFGWAEGVYTETQVRDRHGLGWVAQDVAKIFPKAVGKTTFTKRFEDGTEEYDAEEFDQGMSRFKTVTKTRPTYKEEAIEDCLDLNQGQIMAALYGTVQKLQQQVEALTAKFKQ